MYDNFKSVVVKGIMLGDNYLCIGASSFLICNRTSLSIEELWHQILDYVNYKMLNKISKFETIRGLSKITSQPANVYGPYKLDKQS